MKAQSKDYIALQTLYRAKARSDLASVTHTVRSLESRLARKTTIDGKEIEAFCKGAAFVKLVRGRKLLTAGGEEPFADRTSWAAREMDDEESLFPILVALMALDSATDKIEPITSARDLLTRSATDTFTTTMAAHVSATLSALSASNAQLDLEAVEERTARVVEELQRSGSVELHNISALAGGVVAQEIIKVITKQYVPVDNTCVIDGIQSKSAVFRL